MISRMRCVLNKDSQMNISHNLLFTLKRENHTHTTLKMCQLKESNVI